MSDDRALLHAFVHEGSEAAFTALVARYLPLVHGSAARRLGGDTHRAADVAQQVFIALAREARSLLGHPSLSAWLFTATRNAAVTVIRAEQRRRTREQAVIEPPDAPAAGVPGKPAMLDLALDRLPQRDRDIVLWHFFEGKSFVDIAADLGLRPDAVRKRADRAVERLRGTLEKLGVRSSAAALAGQLSAWAQVGVPPALTTQIAQTATATAAAATSATFLTTTVVSLMKTSTVIAATVVAVTAGALAFSTWRHAGELDAANRSLRVDRDALESRITALQHSNAKLAEELGAVRATIAKAPARAAVAPSAKPIPFDEYRRLGAIHTRAFGEAVFGAFFAQRKLPREKLQAFLDAEGEAAARIEDIGIARRVYENQQGKPPPREVTRAAMDQIRTEEQARLRGLLGDEDYAALQVYAETARLREVTNDLAGLMHTSDTPLTPEQSDALVHALAAAKPGHPPATGPENIDWDTALAQAKTVLLPEQYEMLVQLHRKRDADARMKEMGGG